MICFEAIEDTLGLYQARVKRSNQRLTEVKLVKDETGKILRSKETISKVSATNIFED